MVWRGVDPAHVDSFDIGANRYLRDQLRYKFGSDHEGADWGTIATMLTPSINYARYGLPRINPTVAQWDANTWFAANADVVIPAAKRVRAWAKHDSEKWTKARNGEGILTPSAMGWLILATWHLDPTDFWQQYADGDYSKDTTDPRWRMVLAWRRLNNGDATGRLPLRGGHAIQMHRAALLAACWNAHQGGEQTIKLWDGKPTTFPHPIPTTPKAPTHD
jgi:hypothetical protein